MSNTKQRKMENFMINRPARPPGSGEPSSKENDTYAYLKLCIVAIIHHGINRNTLPNRLIIALVFGEKFWYNTSTLICLSCL